MTLTWGVRRNGGVNSNERCESVLDGGCKNVRFISGTLGPRILDGECCGLLITGVGGVDTTFLVDVRL